MSKVPVFFMRGLNSLGDEILRLGPVPFGPYHNRFVKPFRDFKVIPVLGMGCGRAESMGERALKMIKQTPEFQSASKIHLVGHSLGGLVARYLAHDPEIQEKTISVLTIGTPHRGTPAAEPSKTQGKLSQLVMQLVRATEENLENYHTTRIEGAKEFSLHYPDVEGIHYASIVGKRDFRRLPLGFQILENRNNQDRQASDGLIPTESQKWGHVLDEVSLDHLEQIGVCVHVTPWERIRFLQEFSRQSRLLKAYWSSFNP